MSRIKKKITKQINLFGLRSPLIDKSHSYKISTRLWDWLKMQRGHGMLVTYQVCSAIMKQSPIKILSTYINHIITGLIIENKESNSVTMSKHFSAI